MDVSLNLRPRVSQVMCLNLRRGRRRLHIPFSSATTPPVIGAVVVHERVVWGFFFL